jgi:peptidoglycan/LPS O-acetylase OafA/YrhL
MTRFPALDGIRGIAVVMVFAFHYGGGAKGGVLLRVVNKMRLQGWAGVDVFFVLSGFLITGILYDTRDDSGYFRRFYARRLLRTAPVFYAAVLVLLVLTPIFLYRWHPVHLLFLVYLGNFPADLTPALYQIHARTPATDVYIGHLWSLCVEEQFYLLWPLLLWMVRDRLKLLGTATGLSVLAFLLRCWMVFGGVDLRAGWLLKMLPFKMDALLIGAVLALAMRGGRATRWQQSCKWLLICAGGTIAVLVVLARDQYDYWMPTIGFTLIALTSAGLVGCALDPGSVVYRVLMLRPLRLMGRYSYGFYVYHALFAAAWAALTAALVRRLHSQMLGAVLVVAVNFAVNFMLAKLSYELMERRFLRLKRYFAYDLEATADAGVAAGRTILDKTRFQE